MRTFDADCRQTDGSDALKPHQRLSIAFDLFRDTFRRRSVRRIVYLLGVWESVPDILQQASSVGLANGLAELFAVAKQQGFELVHHQEGNKSATVEVGAHMLAYLFHHCFFDLLRAFRERASRRLLAIRSRASAGIGKAVVIDHGGDGTISVLLKVADYVPPGLRPSPNSATFISAP